MKKRQLGDIKHSTNIFINGFLVILSLLALIPFLFVIIVSLSDEKMISLNGFQIWPEKWSFEAYRFLFADGGQLLTSYGVSIFVTVVGTALAMALTATYAYAISRKDFKYRKFFNYWAFIPMLFSGGLVPTYMIMTQVLNLKNSIWALIVPLLMNAFYITILKTFYMTTIPLALIESAKIDGASEWTIFRKIVLPISLPGLATIALFLTLGYWNDWFNAMLYVSSDKILPLQYLLIRMQNSVDFLTSRAGSLGGGASQALTLLPKETMRMAVVVLTVLPITLAYPFFQQYFVEGLTVGAVKE